MTFFAVVCEHGRVEPRPTDWLAEGCVILAPLLEANGFRLGQPETGAGSGGQAAWVRWTKGEQYVETHVRGALGIVSYGWAGESFSHQDYLRLRGIHGDYPGFSNDPLDGFRHLAHDLDGPAAQILNMTKQEFTATVSAIRGQPRPALP